MKYMPVTGEQEHSTSSKFMKFSWVGIGGGKYRTVGWNTEEVSGSALWLNAASVFTAYSGRAVSFSKHKPGIRALSSVFRLQSQYNCLTYLPSEKE